MTHFCSVTHLDPQVKLFEPIQQKIMEMYREGQRSTQPSQVDRPYFLREDS